MDMYRKSEKQTMLFLHFVEKAIRNKIKLLQQFNLT